MPSPLSRWGREGAAVVAVDVGALGSRGRRRRRSQSPLLSRWGGEGAAVVAVDAGTCGSRGHRRRERAVGFEREREEAVGNGWIDSIQSNGRMYREAGGKRVHTISRTGCIHCMWVIGRGKCT